jgi:hypothetical protein
MRNIRCLCLVPESTRHSEESCALLACFAAIAGVGGFALFLACAGDDNLS